MTASLFNVMLVLHHFEPTKTGKKKILRLWRITFKRFLMISQRTPTSLVNEIMNRDLTLITAHNAQVSKQKWEARKNYERYKPDAKEEEEEDTESSMGNPIRGVPNNFCVLLKTPLRPCPKHPKM